jgi:hypothetical protein
MKNKLIHLSLARGPSEADSRKKGLKSLALLSLSGAICFLGRLAGARSGGVGCIVCRFKQNVNISMLQVNSVRDTHGRAKI